MTLHPDNPYVGPRTYLREESGKFYGREQEARDLLALVVSERLVLFYAQSGAGKSSLINTRTIPGLEEKGFEVLPVGRVSGETQQGCDVENIYLFNLMRSLVEHEQIPGCLSGLSLAEFLARLNRDDKGYFYDDSPIEAPAAPSPAQTAAIWPRALIIDQFEELLSTHPEAWECRAELFREIASAMQADPYLWVLLVMREDYVAALDPYAHLVPGGLRARYYMQQMSYTTALDVIKKPVEKLRPFAEGVAEKLVDDLRAVQVQAPDGSTQTQLGQYVEPVQLQVVCYRLWENLPRGGRQISADDISAVGDVDQSLAEYYAERVAATARQTGVSERLIRQWINTHLITGQGIRGQVLMETGSSGGMSNEVIRLLQDAHLVRAEKRGGASWFELTHDRLVEPVRKNNAAWIRDHLSLLQRQAAVWEQQHRPEELLLRGKALYEAQDWGSRHMDELTEVERDFLAACNAALEREKAEQERAAQMMRLEVAEKTADVERQRAKEQASAARKLRASAVIMAVLLLATIFFLVLTFLSSQARAAAASQAQEAAVTANVAAEAAQVANTRLSDIITSNKATLAANQAELSNNQTAIATSYLALQQYQLALATQQANLAGVQSYYNGLATQNSNLQRTARVTPVQVPTKYVLPIVITPILQSTKLVYIQPSVTPTPAGSITYQGITLKNIRINGSTDYSVHIRFGSNIRVQFDYEVNYPECPTCLVQIQVGLSAATPETCVNAGVSGNKGKSGEIVITAPKSPGKYFLTFDRALEVKCVLDYWWTGVPDPSQFFGRIQIP